MAKGKYKEWLEPEGLILLEGWARDGLTDEQIAHNMGIGIRTLYDYKEKYPQISQSLKKGKEIVDYEVENALLKKALGYRVKEQKFTKDGELIEIEKEIPPDTTACIFWSKNRRPDKWRNEDKNINVNEDNMTININLNSTKKQGG